MEDNSTARHQRPSVAFDIDPSIVSLAKIFSASLHCLEIATAYLKEQNHPDALMLSLLRLRMSRLGEHHQLYQEPLPDFEDRADEVVAVKKALSDFLSLLDADASQSNGAFPTNAAPVTLPRLLKKIDTISVERWPPGVRDLPSSSSLKQYQGHISWSTTQYEMAAEIISDLEIRLFTPHLQDLSLRDLSAAEQRKIDAEGDRLDAAARSSLSIAAHKVDPLVASWVEPVEGREKDWLVLSNIGIGMSFLLPGAPDEEWSTRRRDRIFRSLRRNLK